MIIIDDREVQEHPSVPEDLSIFPFSVERLEAADYAFNDRNSEPTGIERCEIGNLTQKIRSGELEFQLYRCQENYAHVILLTEGIYDEVGGLLAVYKGGSRGYFRAHVYPTTGYDYVEATKIRLSEFGVELINTPNFKCSMMVIKTIYNQRTKPEEEHTLFKRTRALKLPVKLTSNPSVPRLMGLCPRMGEKVAIRLINKYGTIWAILHIDDKELLEVEGMGKGLVSKLREVIGKE